MYIPENKISEIINTSDIVDVISESVILKKSGQNYMGLCPFHSEKTPSFSVSPQKQIFHCFGCGVGGNVFSFLMKYNSITFPESVKILARKYNITIEVGNISPEKKKILDLKEGLFRLNKKVMEYFVNLLSQGDQGQIARQYFIKRGTTDKIIKEFNLGFVPDKWDSLVEFYRKLSIPKNVAEKSGLVLPKKSGSGYYDRFRNRIIFPIFDINMQVAGFGGRVMDDSLPKYLNSPETLIYNKSRILYGLHASKNYCRQKEHVYIVEGYFDFLSLYQHGVRNVVASLGTALTQEHVRLLKGYAKKVILVFDSDDAGINAAKRSIDIFINEGIELKILVLPQDKDPDSFIMEYGKETFKQKALQALSIMQFLTVTAIKSHGNSIQGRVAVLDEMKLYLSKIQDSALRSLHIKELAEKLNVDEKAVLEKVRNEHLSSMERKPFLINADESTIDGINEIHESVRREKQMIAMMLQYPEIHKEIKERKVLDFFYSESLKKIGRKALSFDCDKDQFLSQFMANVQTNEEMEVIASLVITDVSDVKEVYDKSVFLMKRIINLRKKKDNTLTKKIKNAEKNCDSDVFELLAKKQNEIRQLHNEN
ncbi:MAG: DNA primase [Desulfobacteraceae bacterium]|nr:DNA primase [Desulfobacteraceae bacterium]